MPGERLLDIARAWFDEATVVRVFEPLIADLQKEYRSLTGTRRRIQLAQGIAAFARTFVAILARDCRRPLPVGLGGTAWLCTDLFIALGTLLMLLPFGGMLWQTRADLLVPSAMSLALPTSLVPASIVMLGNSRWQTHDVRRAMLRMTVLVTVLMFLLVGWITPIANQEWRVDTAARMRSRDPSSGAPDRGVRELTLPELASSKPPDTTLEPPHTRNHEWHMRLALVTTPVAMMLLGFAAGGHRRATYVRALTWWVATPALWMMLLWLTSARHLPAATVWLTPAALLLIAALSSPRGRPVSAPPV